MKTQPITPARVDFSDPATPSAPDYGDVYHARAGALAQARHVFLGGNGLPQRWQGRTRFVVLETGFGLGNNFLATWAAWRDDPQRAERLVFISIEKHPLLRDDLVRAHAHSPLAEQARQLVGAWPPLTPNLHTLDFEQGRVRLLLALGNARDWLHELIAEVDAFYLDGFAPAKNPELWDAYLLRSLGRLAAPQATAATWSVARSVRDGLQAAGFEVRKVPGFASKGEMTAASYQPRHLPQTPAGRAALAPGAREALVIGAGLAGAACAAALARAGVASTVLDTAAEPASSGSGNPGGLFHGTLNPDDGIHARFNRAAALRTAALLRDLPGLPWLQRGLLRLETERSPAAMQAQIDRLGLPRDYLQAWPAEQAAAISGLPLRQPAWFYPGGGALPPRALVGAWLEQSGARLRLQRSVQTLRQVDGLWQARDAEGGLIGEAPALVIAAGHSTPALLQTLRTADGDLPWTEQRGQITHLAHDPTPPRLPVAGAGYALADGGGGLWCGATAADGDPEPALRLEDQGANLAQWSALSGRPLAELLGQPPAGRVGWRLLLPDRLPAVGGLAAREGEPDRADQARFWPRLPGLVVCSALGSRGIGWSGLCGELAAALLTGAPRPLEAGLVDALDPLRFRVRKSRAATPRA
ncbi:MAG: oxidoreductase [Roseateles depolymerans]|uniref:tRNA 5-methylaminomethyl-2-thiouridine biosynthesis bifunctional protein MnmC n=1 Tax=Roseateles depolymerans TaxID=76731 RepID=A0A2W5DH91_9BURK|nr:MAG: oxidoreductase [Roseateles depolymerans]